MADPKKLDLLWDDNPVDITPEANFIWSIANKLRGSYMPDKYGDVIIPMTIIRRFECALEATKAKVVETYQKNPNYPAKAMQRISGHQFYNTSEYSLAELCNDPDHIAENFLEYLNGFSANVQDIFHELNMSDHIKKMDKDREKYYRSVTGMDWGDSRTYDLCLNTSVLGIEKSCDLIEQAVRIFLQERGIDPELNANQP